MMMQEDEQDLGVPYADINALVRCHHLSATEVQRGRPRMFQRASGVVCNDSGMTAQGTACSCCSCSLAYNRGCS